MVTFFFCFIYKSLLAAVPERKERKEGKEIQSCIHAPLDYILVNNRANHVHSMYTLGMNSPYAHWGDIYTRCVHITTTSSNDFFSGVFQSLSDA